MENEKSFENSKDLNTIEAVQKNSEKLKIELEKAGFPLEFRAKSILKKFKYSAQSYRYAWSNKIAQEVKLKNSFEDDTEVYREIDILASKSIGTSSAIPGFDISFRLNLVCECKHFANTAIFAFDGDQPMYNEFPIFANGDKIKQPPFNRYLEFDNKIEKVTLWRVGKFNKQDGNFNDTEIHDACEQLMGATIFKTYKTGQLSKDEYNIINQDSWWFKFWKDNQKKYEPIYGQKKEKLYLDELSLKFHPKLNNIICPTLNINLIVPILILGEDTPLMKVKMQESQDGEKISKFEEIKYGVYYHISQNQATYDLILKGHYAQPIIICNIKYLQECLLEIEIQVNKTVNNITNSLVRDPYLCISELMFSKIHNQGMLY